MQRLSPLWRVDQQLCLYPFQLLGDPTCHQYHYPTLLGKWQGILVLCVMSHRQSITHPVFHDFVGSTRCMRTKPGVSRLRAWAPMIKVPGYFYKKRFNDFSMTISLLNLSLTTFAEMVRKCLISSCRQLRLERGGEHVILPSCTKTVTSLLMYKIS